MYTQQNGAADGRHLSNAASEPNLPDWLWDIVLFALLTAGSLVETVLRTRTASQKAEAHDRFSAPLRN